MKRFVWILAAVLILPGVCFARDRLDPRERVNARVFKTWKPYVLDLTCSTGVSKFLGKHNGTFSRASDQYVFDYDGVLQRVGTNMIAIRGARLSGGQWYNTDASGNPLSSVSGFAVWPSETNTLDVGKYRGSGVTTWDAVSGGIVGDTSGTSGVGIDGSSNSSAMIGEANAAGADETAELIGDAADTKQGVFSVYVKKDDDETRFPEIRLYYSLTARHYIQINTKTGAKADRIGAGTYASGVEHVVDSSGTTQWYRVWIMVQDDNSGNARCGFVPAYTDVFGNAANNAAVGYVQVDWAQFEDERLRPTAPIVGGQTRAVNDLHFPAAKVIKDPRGAVYMEAEMSPEWHGMVTHQPRLLSDGSIIMLGLDATSGEIELNDGSAPTLNITPRASLNRFVGWWSGTAHNLLRDGGADSDLAGAYDGAFGTNANLYLGCESSVDYAFQGFIRRVEFWPKRPKTQAFWERYTD